MIRRQLVVELTSLDLAVVRRWEVDLEELLELTSARRAQFALQARIETCQPVMPPVPLELLAAP